jgi:hypothetical protein
MRISAGRRIHSICVLANDRSGVVAHLRSTLAQELRRRPILASTPLFSSGDVARAGPRKFRHNGHGRVNIAPAAAKPIGKLLAAVLASYIPHLSRRNIPQFLSVDGGYG